MRKLNLKDTQFINQIAYIHELELAKQAHMQEPTTFAVSLREEMIFRRLKYMDDVIYCYIKDERLIGFIWGHCQKEDKVVVVEMLFVTHDYRDKHIASELKEAIEQWAIANNIYKVVGTVNKDNQAMIELNNKLGYSTEKLIMSKDLTTKDEQLKE
ncbi:GNAT family N-acetyltransferase [Helicobacter pylori]